MTNRIQPESTAKIGGKTYKLRWDKGALFRMASQPDAVGDLDPEDSLAVFQRAVILAWCCVKAAPFKDPESLAEAIADDELIGLAEAVTAAFTNAAPAKEGERDGPLSNGPLRVGGWD
jgi:hypothetical protein